MVPPSVNCIFFYCCIIVVNSLVFVHKMLKKCSQKIFLLVRFINFDIAHLFLPLDLRIILILLTLFD